MNRFKIHSLILCVAAILFVAKPFLGFEVLGHIPNSAPESSLLAKAFTQRKPEFLEEASERAAALGQLIKDKAHEFKFSLNALMVAFLAAQFGLLLSFRNRFIAQHFQRSYAVEPLYLRHCRLTI